MGKEDSLDVEDTDSHLGIYYIQNTESQPRRPEGGGKWGGGVHMHYRLSAYLVDVKVREQTMKMELDTGDVVSVGL